MKHYYIKTCRLRVFLPIAKQHSEFDIKGPVYRTRVKLA